MTDHRRAAPGLILAGGDYRLQIDVAAERLCVIGDSHQPVAYLSLDNSRGEVDGRDLRLVVQRRRLSWELVLSDAGGAGRVAVARPRLRPGAYRIDDDSRRRLRLSRGLRSDRWRLHSERGRIADFDVETVLGMTRTRPGDWLDGRTAAEIEIRKGPVVPREVSPLILLALATIRADLSIPTPDVAPAGG